MDWDALLTHEGSCAEMKHDDEIWHKISDFFVLPPEFEDGGTRYKTVLEFDNGEPVKSADDWKVRRQEILKTWHGAMGEWLPLVEDPKIEFVGSQHTENFTRHKINLEIGGGLMQMAYLLVPDGAKSSPAVLDVFYGPEAGAGLDETRRFSIDFGYQMAKRGFVGLCLGSPGGNDVRMHLAEHKRKLSEQLQPLSYLAYVAANAWNALANLPQTDPDRIGVVGHSFGGKWAMFASCLYEKFACACWSDPGIVFDETRVNVNYWDPWYLGYESDRNREQGLPCEENPRTGAYKQLVESGHDLHELHALMAPRPFFVSGGSEDTRARWKALRSSVEVNRLLGYDNRVGMANREGHSITPEANEQICLFFQHFLGNC